MRHVVVTSAICALTLAAAYLVVAYNVSHPDPTELATEGLREHLKLVEMNFRHN